MCCAESLTRLAAVLVQHNEVRVFVGPARLAKLLHDGATTIDPGRIGEAEPHLLQTT